MRAGNLNVSRRVIWDHSLTKKIIKVLCQDCEKFVGISVVRRACYELISLFQETED